MENTTDIDDFDALASIARINVSVFVDAGTSGHGFKIAPMLGKHVADLVAGDVVDPALADFDPLRFERGRPLRSFETVVNLIAATTTRTGLRVRSALDTGAYPAGLRVSDAEMATLHLARDAFHGEWNYTLIPRQHLMLADAVVS